MAGSQLLLELVQDFSKRRVRGSFDDGLRVMQEIGFFQPALRESGVADLCLVLTELSRVDAALAVALLSHWAAIETLRCARSDFKTISLLAFPAFSDFREFAVTERDGKVFISGNIESVLLAGHASHAVVSGYLLSLKASGVSVSSPVRTLGLRSCPHVDILVDQAPAVRLGGVELFGQMCDRMALAAGAVALGIAQGSMDEALRYAKTRRQGGKEIFRWSEVKMLLGNMLLQLQAGRLALTRACSAAELGEAGWERDSAAISISLQEMACTLSSNGIQVLGGAGYTTEFAQEQRFRDAFHTQNLLGLLPGRKLKLADRYELG